MRGGKLILAAASAVAALLVAEGALRLAPQGSEIYQQAAPRQVASPDFAHLLEPDPDPRLRMRLRPGLDADFKGTRVRTNAAGFRGPELRDGTYRIAAIGDSVMFGWGVAEEETYLRLLERSLAAVRADVEVVNLAVPAYNTVQEVALLERHAAALRPAWVVVGFVGNDFDPVMKVFPRTGLLERHSWLYRLMEIRSRGLTPAARAAHRKQAALDALHRLGAQARERGFSVAAFLYAGLVTGAGERLAREHPEVKEACVREGFLVIELRPMLERAIAAGEIESSFDIWLRKEKPIDPHPSPLGHRIIARGLHEALAARVRGSMPAGS